MPKGFRPYTYQSGLTPWSHLPAAAGDWQVGQAAKIAAGAAAPTTAGDSAEGLHYICMYEGPAGGGETEIRPFILASSAGLILEVELTAAIAALAAGSKYTISSDGMSITGTTTDGVFEVIWFSGTAIGVVVRGRMV